MRTNQSAAPLRIQMLTMQEVADRLGVSLERAYEMGMLAEDARQQGLKFKVNQRIFRAGTLGAAVRGGRGPDGRRQRPGSQRPPAWTANELANIFVLAIRAGLPAETLKETVFAYPTQISGLLWML